MWAAIGDNSVTAVLKAEWWVGQDALTGQTSPRRVSLHTVGSFSHVIKIYKKNDKDKIYNSLTERK